MTDRLDRAIADARRLLEPGQPLNPHWPTARPERKPGRPQSSRTILRHETGVEIWEDAEGYQFRTERQVRATQTSLRVRTERLTASRAA